MNMLKRIDDFIYRPRNRILLTFLLIPIGLILRKYNELFEILFVIAGGLYLGTSLYKCKACGKRLSDRRSIRITLWVWWLRFMKEECPHCGSSYVKN